MPTTPKPTSAFRKGLQIRLAWTGDYAGAFDGTIDARSLRAVRDFQARHGMVADGVINEAMLKLLIARSDAVQRDLDVSLVDDKATGARALLPLGLVSDKGPTEVGNLWRSDDSKVEIETVRIADTGQTLKGLFDVLSQPTADRTVTDSELGTDWFHLSGVDEGRDYTMRFAARGGDLRGFSVAYDPSEAARLKPFVTVASGMFQPFAGEPKPPLVASREGHERFSDLLAKRHREDGAGVGGPRDRRRDPLCHGLCGSVEPAPVRDAEQAGAS